MVRFGGVPGPSGGAGEYSPTTDFLRQTGAAALPQWHAPSSGSSGPSTPEEALAQRPFKDVGKTTLSVYGRGAVPMGSQVNAPPMDIAQIHPTTVAPKDESLPATLGNWAQFVSQTILPMMTPGMWGIQRVGGEIGAWNQALTSEDPQVKALAEQWERKIGNNEIDAHGGMSGFYDQYMRYQAEQKGESAYLQMAATPGLPSYHGDPGALLGQSLGEALKPLSVLQQAAVRTLGTSKIAIGDWVLHDDRVAETERQYAAPDHGKLTPGLVQITEQYHKGEINQDEMRDLIVLEGFALTDPEPMGEGNLANIPVSLGLEIISDPLTYLSGGTAILAHLGASASKAIVPNVLRELTKTGLEEGIRAVAPTSTEAVARGAAAGALEFGAGDVASAVGDVAARASGRTATQLIEDAAVKVTGKTADTLSDMDLLKGVRELAYSAEHGAAVREALAQTPKLSYFAMKAPTIVEMGSAIDKALDGVTLVSKTAGAARARMAVSHVFAEGFINGLGWSTVHHVDDVLRGVGIKDNAVVTLRGRAAANHAIQVGNDTILRRMRSEGKWRPDDPTQVARQAAEMLGADVRGPMARQVDLTAEYIVPRGRGGMTAGLTAWREWAAQAMTELGATGDVARAAKRLSENDIRYLKNLFWAHMIEVVDTARKKAMPTPNFSGDLIDRVQMLGPRQMTEADRAALLDTIDTADIGTITTAVERFENLKVNVNPTTLTDSQLRYTVKELLTELADKVPVALTDSEDLPQALRDFLATYGDRGYQLGLRPADDELAQVLKNPAGDVIGVNSYVDHVVDSVPTDRISASGAIMRDLSRGIGADAIQRSATRRFVQELGTTVGATEADSKMIYKSVRKIADEMGTTPRGLRVGDFERAVDEVAGRIDPKIIANGKRAIVDAVMQAHEGEMRLVGVTQKVTGRAKVVLGSNSNWAGFVSENMYPMVRFAWSPVFIAQEIFELPFFLILKGKYPVRSLIHDAVSAVPGGERIAPFAEHAATRETFDNKTKFVMDGYAQSTYVAADMIEQSDIMRKGFVAAGRIVNRAGRLGRMGEKLVSAVGNYTNVYSRKELGERLVYRNRMGEEFKKAMMEESPMTWMAARSKYPKEMSDGEFAISYLYDIMSRSDPESIFARESPPMFSPFNIGRRSRFSPSLTGHIVAGEPMTLKGLRAAVKNDADPLTMGKIESALRHHGADEDYIERARYAISGTTEDDFYDALVAHGVPRTQADAMRAGDVKAANLAGVGLNEYLSRRWADAPQAIDQFGDQKGTYAFQLIVDSLESRGLIAPERGSAMLRDLTARGDELVVDWDEFGKIQISRRKGEPGVKVGELAPDVRKARAKRMGWEGAHLTRRADETGTLGAPPTRADGEALYRSGKHIFGKPTYPEWIDQFEATIPEEGRREYADWYTDMQRGFLAMFSDTPDTQVEDAARMIVAFGVTQLNTSPANGMEFLYRVMSMARRGEDWPAALGLSPSEMKRVRQASGGLNYSQLEQILMERGGGKAVPEQLGQKLSDFIDSLIGKKTRSVGLHGPDPLRPWGPVAGDVWAKRDLGFIDPKMADKIHLVVDGGASSKAIGTPKLDAKGKQMFDVDGDPMQNVDRIEVYNAQGETILTIPKEHIGDSVPSDLEYDYIVEYYNGLADYLNEMNYLNREWTAADAQAVGWFRAKKAFGDDTGDVRSALYKGRWTVGSEINPVAREYAPPPTVLGNADEARVFRADMRTDYSTHGIPYEQMPPMTGAPNSVQSFDAKAFEDNAGFEDLGVGPGDRRVYVYYDDLGDPAGHVVVTMENGKATYVDQVRVRPDAKRQGVASALYNKADADGIEIRKVTGRNTTREGGRFSAAYVDKVVPYSAIVPPASDVAPEVAQQIRTELTQHVVRAALADSGVMTPRMAGTRFVDGLPVRKIEPARFGRDVRGNATVPKAFKSEEGFVYRTVNQVRAANDWRQGEFVARHPATIYADDANSVVLRAKESVGTWDQPAGGVGAEGNLMSSTGVPASNVEVLAADGTWHPVRQAGLVDKGTVGSVVTKDGEVIESEVVEVLGDRTAAEQAAARIGLYGQMDEVVMIRDTNVASLDYANAKGKGNIGAIVRVPINDPEEGAQLLAAIADGSVPTFPSGAHLGQADDGSWFVQGLWDPKDGPATGRAFTKSVAGVDQEVAAALDRDVVIEQGPVEFVRVRNNWATSPNGEEFHGVISRPSHVISKFGGEHATVPSEAAGELERARQRELTHRAEGIVQQTVPREAAAARTGALYDGPLADTGTGKPRSADDILRSSGGVQFQRAPSGTRAAIVHAGDGRDSLYFGGARVAPDSLLHELAHAFAYDLEPSAVRRIKGIRAGLEGTRPGTARGRHANRLTTADQEWIVSQYLLWAKDPDSVHVTMRPLMEAFRREVTDMGPITAEALAPMTTRVANAKATLDAAVKAGTATPQMRTELKVARAAVRDAKKAPDLVHPDMRQLFNDAAEAAKHKQSPAMWDVDEDVAQQWAQRAHMRSLQYSRDLVHFKSQRSVLERSLNHPFLGMYPLSYYYGKVLPELLEFLLFRPFGVKAPGVAYSVTNRMFQSFTRQQEHDDELRTYMYENEPALRALSMFVPGTPWEIPVNAPLAVRRILEAQMTNAQRIDQGKEPLNVDYAKIGQDVLGYQFGLGRSPQTLTDTVQGLMQLPGIMGGAAGLTPRGDAPQQAGPFGVPPPQQAAQPQPVSPTDGATNLPPAQPEADVQVGAATVPVGEITDEINQQIQTLSEQLGGVQQ